MDRYFIGIDIGTTGTKTVLLHEHRGIVAQSSAESPLYSLEPAFAESDAQTWEHNALAGIAHVIREGRINPHDVVAIATTGMVPAVVLLDQDLLPIRRPILQNDARASREIEELRDDLDGPAMLAATGSALTQQSVAPTALWLQRHEPGAWERTRHVVGSYDYVLMHLGAELHVEENWGLESGLYTIDGAPYWPGLVAGRLTEAMLAPSVRPGTVVGTISGSIAEATGLSTQTLLVAGGADHVLSAFAAGIDHPGDWLIKLGGAGDILTAADRPIVDARLYLDAHPREGVWLPNGCMATSGSLLRWFQALVGGVALVDLDAEAKDRPPAAVLCLPYFLGEKSPIHDPLLRGAYVGLDLSNTRADLYRASLEAIAFGFRHNAEAMTEAGITLSRALVTNGGSKSTLWKQIHADVLGTPVYPVRDHPGASLGAAILAGVGAGALALDDIHRFLILDEPYVPDPRTRNRYDDRYALWRQAGSVLEPISHELASNP